jgi:hypothetical protein
MLIVPVTPQLLAAMVKAHNAIKAYDVPDRKRCDKTQYSEAADVLETLTVSVLSATSALSLIKVNPVGARFNMADGSSVAMQASGCAAYLRTDATRLLSENRFSQYELVHTSVAMDYLKGLYGTLSGAITRQMRADLTTIELLGPGQLVNAAKVVSDIVSNQTQSN